MNCQEALSLLYDIIDREASEIDAREVEEHLAQCRDCSGLYKIERSIAKLLQERLVQHEPTAHFAELKTSVLRQLDQIDSENC